MSEIWTYNLWLVVILSSYVILRNQLMLEFQLISVTSNIIQPVLYETVLQWDDLKTRSSYAFNYWANICETIHEKLVRAHDPFWIAVAYVTLHLLAMLFQITHSDKLDFRILRSAQLVKTTSAQWDGSHLDLDLNLK